MIVEVGSEVQALVGNLTGYLGVLGIPPRTYGSWVESHVAGRLVDPPPPVPTKEETERREGLRARMRELAHRRHYTFGLAPLWNEVRETMSREDFRRLAREVRAEVNRERRSQILRYEFLFPDVAHSIDFQDMPRDFPGGAKRYLVRILDECTRLTLRKALTDHKGAGMGYVFVRDHLRAGQCPLLFKYDWEFAVPQFEQLLLDHRIVPLPSPRRYPQHNGKMERSNKDVQQWLGVFDGCDFWGYNELETELGFCFEQLDDVEARAMFGGRTRRQAYDQMPRATVDRDAFFQAASIFRHEVLMRPNVAIHPTDAWRLAAKETLKKFDLVRYSRP
jgi:transposase InsO family protein